MVGNLMNERLIFVFLKQIYFSNLSGRSAPIPDDSRPPVSLQQINSFYKSIVLWLNIGNNHYYNCLCFRHTITCLEGGLQFPENKYTQICNHLEE